MRTTLTIDEQTGKALKKRAAETGKTFKQVVNETLARGLSNMDPERYRETRRNLGGPRSGVDLSKAISLAAVLEDGELVRKLELRK